MTSSKMPGAAVVGTGFGLFTHVRALRDAGFEVRAIIAVSYTHLTLPTNREV